MFTLEEHGQNKRATSRQRFRRPLHVVGGSSCPGDGLRARTDDSRRSGGREPSEPALRRGRRFAKVARHQRTGLKFTISGPFLIGSLVGVGWRWMILGPGLGTLAGTLEPMPTCAY